MNKGKLIGVGVGPGDPKLLTIKAIEAIQNADYVAYPTSGEKYTGEKSSNLALSIVKDYIEGKELLEYLMPMSRDKEYVRKCHDDCAEDVKKYLEKGKTVAFITLGDPAIYSTYIYIHHKIKRQGFETLLIPGITSFCAVAASLDDSLCEGAQPLLIVPGSFDTLDKTIDYVGNKVYMKSGRAIVKLREKLREHGRLKNAKMVERATLPDEKVYNNLDDIDEKSSYFSIVVVKEDINGDYQEGV